MKNFLMDKDNTVLVGIDFQEKLMPAMKNSDDVQDKTVKIYDSDSIKIPELIQALSATDTGSKYELIGFDACLMATIDVADACDEFADYLVASEEFEPGCGWSYDAFMEKLECHKGNHAVGLRVMRFVVERETAQIIG